jgi:hypothetical protein
MWPCQSCYNYSSVSILATTSMCCIANLVISIRTGSLPLNGSINLATKTGAKASKLGRKEQKLLWQFPFHKMVISLRLLQHQASPIL